MPEMFTVENWWIEVYSGKYDHSLSRSLGWSIPVNTRKVQDLTALKKGIGGRGNGKDLEV